MMNRFQLGGIGATVVAGAATAALAFAAPSPRAGARPDPSFGGGRGWVRTRLHGLDALAYAAPITGSRSAGNDIYLARYLLGSGHR